MTTVKEIHPQEKNLMELFIGKRYSVPKFQRPYSWDKEQLDKLYGDIDELIAFYNEGRANARTNKRNLNNEERVHFLGNMVLLKNHAGFEIIDGQQRIIALTILFRCIEEKISKLSRTQQENTEIQERITNKLVRLIYDENHKPCLDNDYVEALFGKREGVDLSTGLARKNMRKMKIAKEFFKEKIKDYDLKRLFILLDAVSSRMQVITIEIDDEIDGITLFQTLNDRGMRLTYGDLVKSNILKCVYEKNRDEFEDCEEIWEEILDNLGEADTGKFIRHYCIANEDFESTTLQKIYSEIVRKLKDDEDYALELTKNIKVFSEYYAQLIEPDQSSLGQLFNELNELGAERCYPLILSLLHNIKEKKQQQAEITKKTISLTFRYSTIMNSDAKELERLYANSAKRLKDEHEDAVEDILNDLKRKFPAQDPYKAVFLAKDDMKHSVARYIFQKIEYHLDEGSKRTVGSSTHDVEDIFPREPQQWERAGYTTREIEELRKCQSMLGNLALMKKEDNRTVKNKSFDKKKEYYKKSKIHFTNKLVNVPNWTPTEIQKRQAELYNLSLKIWN